LAATKPQGEAHQRRETTHCNADTACSYLGNDYELFLNFIAHQTDMGN
jgi:hypothetical protein